jgi:hypothetical protein
MGRQPLWLEIIEMREKPAPASAGTGSLRLPVIELKHPTGTNFE